MFEHHEDQRTGAIASQLDTSGTTNKAPRECWSRTHIALLVLGLELVTHSHRAALVCLISHKLSYNVEKEEEELDQARHQAFGDWPGLIELDPNLRRRMSEQSTITEKGNVLGANIAVLRILKCGRRAYSFSRWPVTKTRCAIFKSLLSKHLNPPARIRQHFAACSDYKRA